MQLTESILIIGDNNYCLLIIERHFPPVHLFLGKLDRYVAHSDADKEFNYCVRTFGGWGTRICSIFTHVLWRIES